MDNYTTKDHPQLLNIKRLSSIANENSPISSSQDDQISSSPPVTSMNKCGSQTSLQTISSTRSSISNIFKVTI